jgi:hypothetical protein
MQPVFRMRRNDLKHYDRVVSSVDMNIPEPGTETIGLNRKNKK